MWPFKRKKSSITRELFAEALWEELLKFVPEITRTLMDDEIVKRLAISEAERYHLHRAIVISLLWAASSGPIPDQKVLASLHDHYFSFCAPDAAGEEKDLLLAESRRELNEIFCVYQAAYEKSISSPNVALCLGFEMARNWLPRLGARPDCFVATNIVNLVVAYEMAVKKLFEVSSHHFVDSHEEGN
jgi:hypothetical protein